MATCPQSNLRHADKQESNLEAYNTMQRNLSPSRPCARTWHPSLPDDSPSLSAYTLELGRRFFFSAHRKRMGRRFTSVEFSMWEWQWAIACGRSGSKSRKWRRTCIEHTTEHETQNRSWHSSMGIEPSWESSMKTTRNPGLLVAGMQSGRVTWRVLMGRATDLEPARRGVLA